VWGADPAFDYALALELGWSHAQVQQLTTDEYVRWKAYMTVRANLSEHEHKVAAMRASR
jgi:hypothetical protein